MQTNDVNAEDWSESFQNAIDSKNPEEIKKLIRLLPAFDSEEQMRHALCQTVDAEAVLLEIRRNLVQEQEKLRSIRIV